MNRVGPGPISPLSASSNDSSFVSRYGGPGGTPNENSYGGGPYSAARPPQTSPPSSQHPSGSTDMSRPSQGGSSIGGGRPPSSASSIARSSDGRMFGPGPRDSTRSAVNPHNEDALQRHHAALRIYLAASLQDEKGNIKPNRARDKLLRLSVTQFMELSTDVFDELIRREDERLQRVQNVPRSLPPKQNFHPKRNQARQKLSTLPLERFRQLATDVFYELERRIPRFAGGDIDRPMSGNSMRSQSRGGMRPPPPGFRPPPRGAGGRPPMSPGGPNSMGPPRPLPKTFQSNTIIPNKSTMVEDDDDDEEFGLPHNGTGLSRFDVGSTEDKEKIEAQGTEISELKQKLEDLENKLAEKDGSVSSQREELEQKLEDLENKLTEKDGSLSNLQEELEQKHIDALKLNENLRQELDQLHKDKTQDEREIRAQHDRNLEDHRAQLDNAHAQTDDLYQQLQTHQAENEELRHQLQHGQQHQASNSEYEKRIELLQQELATQQKLTNEVREEATMYLGEMRDLSKQNDDAIEQEEKLSTQVSKLENEIDEWRQRYAKIKAQNKNLRASAVGLGLQTSFDAGSLFRKEALVSEGGLVKDVDVTRFQIAIDELLKAARQSSTEPMVDTVKNVIVCVQSITSSIGTDGYPTPAPSPLSPNGNAAQPMSVGKLKARVTGTANSLITATKQHASASGLSPVALLDAAASNLTSSVVELVKAVGIHPSPKFELQDEVEDNPHDSLGSFYDDRLSSTGEEGISPPLNPTSAPAVQVDAPEANPVPFGLARSNTFKKMNGWFGWGNKVDEPPPATPTINGHSQTEDYDPYR